MVGTAVALALGSALLWGTGDYLGGSAARSRPALAVAFWSQAMGLALAGCAALAVGAALPGEAAIWALGAGAVGAVALALFYAALASGAMTIVAPLSALGTIIPVVVALARGETPGTLGYAGMTLALAGAVAASLGAEEGHHTRLSRRALWLSAGAAIGIGAVLALMQRAIDVQGADTLAVVAAMRVSGVVLLGALVLSAGAGTAPTRTILAVGVFDTSANVLFTAASAEGEDGIVAVLGALYPITTVLLAAALLHERPQRVQVAGVVAALAGVGLIASR